METISHHLTNASANANTKTKSDQTDEKKKTNLININATMKLFSILMFAASCLAVSVLVVSADKPHFGSPDGSLSTGTSKQFRTEDNLGNFNFGYDESHGTGSTSRREESSNGVRRGMYSLYDADGRQRIVNYIADENGFRAQVQTNEPGYEPKDSADVLVNKNHQQQGASGEAYAATRPTYADAPVKRYSAPAPVKSYSAPVEQAPIYQEKQERTYEEPEASPEPSGPWTFSYSFDSTHAAPAKPLAVESYSAPTPVKSYSAPARAQVKSYTAPDKSLYRVPAQTPVKSYSTSAAPVYQEQQQQQNQQSFDY